LFTSIVPLLLMMALACAFVAVAPVASTDVLASIYGGL
jgi:hypothetical protein